MTATQSFLHSPFPCLPHLYFQPLSVLPHLPHLPHLPKLLGLITTLFNLTSDTIVAWFAEPIGQYLKRHRQLRKRQQTVSGLALIELGTYVAVAEQK